MKSFESKRHKIIYITLAVFFGVFGVHQFFNRKIWFGLAHISWLPFFIISGILSRDSPILSGDGLLPFLISITIFPVSLITSLIQGIIQLSNKE